jgi:hypothetical protein
METKYAILNSDETSSIDYSQLVSNNNAKSNLTNTKFIIEFYTSSIPNYLDGKTLYSKSEIKNIIRNTGSSNEWINNILDEDGSTYSEDII